MHVCVNNRLLRNDTIFMQFFAKLNETIEINELNQLVHRVQWLIFSPWARPRSWNRNHMNLSLFLTSITSTNGFRVFLLFSSIGRFLFFRAKTIKWPRWIFLFNGNVQKIRKFIFIWICRLQILNWRWKKTYCIWFSILFAATSSRSQVEFIYFEERFPLLLPSFHWHYSRVNSKR